MKINVLQNYNNNNNQNDTPTNCGGDRLNRLSQFIVKLCHSYYRYIMTHVMGIAIYLNQRDQKYVSQILLCIIRARMLMIKISLKYVLKNFKICNKCLKIYIFNKYVRKISKYAIIYLIIYFIFFYFQQNNVSTFQQIYANKMLI